MKLSWLYLVSGALLICAVKGKKGGRKKGGDIFGGLDLEWGAGGFNWGKAKTVDVNDEPSPNSYKKLTGKKIKGHPLGRSFVRSPSICAAYCDTLPRCMGFNYKISKQKCQPVTFNEFTGGKSLKKKNGVVLFSKLSAKLDCPDGSVLDPVKPRCYKANLLALPWEKAKGACEGQGGSLLVIPDKGTHFAIWDLISPTLDGRDTWVGLRSSKNQIGWEFRGMRSQVKDIKGKIFEGLRPTEDMQCGVAMTNKKGRMSMFDCDSPKAYVCEYRTEDDFTVNEPCPSDTEAFNGKCYWSVTEATPFQLSSDACTDRGGSLVSILSENDNSYMAELWERVLGAGGRSWLSLRYSENDKEWTWAGGSTMDETSWIDNNQAKQGKKGKECAVGRKQGDTIKYEAAACDEGSNSYICQGEASRVTSNQCDTVTCPANSVCEEGTLQASCQCLPGFTAKRKKKGKGKGKGKGGGNNEGAQLECEASNLCQAHGDPHYKTFDGATIHYQGLCRHSLVGVCSTDLPESAPKWDIKVNNIRRKGKKPDVAYTEYVEVSLYGHIIRMGIDNLVVVDGELRSAGFSLEDGAISINYRSDGTIALETDIGLTVTYLEYRVTVQAPTVYAGKVCGLCGDFDGDKENDLKMDMSLNQEQEYIGTSGCEIPQVNVIDQCDPSVKEYAQEKCGLITTMSSLAECRDSPNILLSPFIDDCVEDACAGEIGDVDSQLCVAMEAVTQSCANIGIVVSNIYRIEAQCNMDCGDNSFYNPRMSLDVATCQNPDGSYDVSNGIGEGCQCMPGFILEGDDCISIDDCGCTMPGEDIYMEQGTTMVDPNCMMKWTCNSEGELTSVDLGGCAEEAECAFPELEEGQEVRPEGTMRTCICKEGMVGDGWDLCRNENDCEYNTGSEMILIPAGKSYVDSSCREITCDKGPVVNVGDSLCGVNAECKQNQNVNECSCKQGYAGDPMKECVDETLCQYTFDAQEGPITMQSGDTRMNSDCQMVTCASNAPKPDVTGNLCVSDAECAAVKGGYECVCSKGFVGDGHTKCEDTTICYFTDDKNEMILTIGDEILDSKCRQVSCVLGPDATIGDAQCASNAVCSAPEGASASYSCECPEGFTGDGKIECKPVDTCQYTFNEKVGAVEMKSGETQMNSNCQQVTCAANAPKADETSRLCVTNAQCVPSEGSFKCECAAGFTGNGEELCTNDDDCIYKEGSTETRMKPGDSFTNSKCEEVVCVTGPIPDVSKSPCVTHSSCVSKDTINYSCTCDEGFTGNALVECQEDTSGTGDPHFIVTSRMSSTRLCYDVHGYQNDVMLLIQDPNLKLEVNGKLFEVNGSTVERPLSYFSEMAVMYDGNEIIASQDDVMVNGQLIFKWNDTSKGMFSLGSSTIVRPVGPAVFEVQCKGFTLQVSRTYNSRFGHYLGIYVTHSDAFTSNTDGVIGRFIRSSFDLIDSYDTENSSTDTAYIEFLDRSTVIPVTHVSRFSHAHHGMIDCWLYVATIGDDTLLGTMNNYMVPSLTYTPFVTY